MQWRDFSLIGDDLDALPAELGEIYDYITDRRGTAIAAAIRSLARPGGLPGLVHCTAGKDRTGIVVTFVTCAELTAPRSALVTDGEEHDAGG